MNDTSITNFMTWLWKSDTAFHSTRDVNSNMIKLHSLNFTIPDSNALNNLRYSENIFNKRNKLETYFDQADADFFVRQVRGQKKFKWRTEPDGVKLLDTITSIKNRPAHVIFSYSLPIFSSNQKYVIIVEAFYCGLVCGGGHYSLYHRESGNSWTKIKEFNLWEE